MAMDRSEFSLKALKDALESLEIGISSQKDELGRDGCIQRFEYTFELSWKTLKKFLESSYNISENNVKNLFREAGRLGLISSVETWFEFQHARNQTSHIYSRRIAEFVFASAQEFSKECRKLVKNMEALLES